MKLPVHHKGSTLSDENKSSKPTKVSLDMSITRFTTPTSTSIAPKGEQNSSSMTVLEFLQYQGQTVHRVLGDGNCMFIIRSLSHQVYGTEDEHWNTRLTLQVLEEILET